jgi:hypothetical protein
MPTITSFTTSASSVTSGGSATLTWTVTNGVTCYLKNSVSGSVTTLGGCNTNTSTGALTSATRFTLMAQDASNFTAFADVIVSVGTGALSVTTTQPNCGTVALGGLCQIIMANTAGYTNPNVVMIRGTITNGTTGHSWVVNGFWIGVSVNVTGGGSGYTTSTTVSYSPTGCGTNNTLTAPELNAGALDRIDVIPPANMVNCTSTPTITLAVAGSGATFAATDPTLWGLNFRGVEAGSYTTSIRFSAPTDYKDVTPSFTVSAGTWPGFLALYGGGAPTQLKTNGDGKWYNPIGFQEGFNLHCCSSPNDAANFLTLNGSGINNKPTNPFSNTFSIYAASGYNLWRSNGLDNPNVYQTVSSTGNLYLGTKTRANDAMLADALANGIHVQMAPIADPTSIDLNSHGLVGFDMTNLTNVEIAARSYQYAIDRFGWYVDIWELGGEINPTSLVATANFFNSYSNYFKLHDPYTVQANAQKLVTVSYPPGAAGLNYAGAYTVPTMDIYSTHAYFGGSREPSLALQSDIATQVSNLAAAYAGAPLQFGETGTTSLDYDPTYHERYRMELRTFFQVLAQPIPFGGFSCTGAGGAFQDCMGSANRAYAKVFQPWAAASDPTATAATPTLTLTTPAAQTGARYCRSSSTYYGCYLVHTNDHSTPITASSITLTVPANTMVATWTDPATGFVLKSQTVNSGSQTLTAPTWTTDLALQILPAVTGIGSVTITDTSGSAQTGRPTTVSRVFKQGDIANYPQPTGPGVSQMWQADVRTRWPDNSAKHVMVSWFETLAASGSDTIAFVNNTNACSTGTLAACQNAALTNSQALTPPWAYTITINGSDIVTAATPVGWDIDVELTNGTTLTADSRTMLSDDVTAGKSCGGAGSRCRYWLQGPVVTEIIAEGPRDDASHTFDYDMGWDTNCPGATNCKPLHAIFDLTFYDQWPGVLEKVTVENMWSTKLEDVTYTGSVKNTNGLAATPYSTTGTVTHYATERWGQKRFWDGTAPGTVKTDLNLAYIISTGALPNYDTSNSPVSAGRISTTLSNWNGSNKGVDVGAIQNVGGIGYVGNITTNMPNTGGRDDIGPTTEWHIDYLYGFDTTMETVSRGHGDLAGEIPWHMRESRNDVTKYCATACTGANATVPAFGHYLSIDARPTIYAGQYRVCWFLTSVLTAMGDAITPVSTMLYKDNTPGNPNWQCDVAHQADMTYVPYLTSGDFYYYEELMLNVHWDLANNDPTNTTHYGRHGNFGVLNYDGMQQRGFAWWLRTMLNAEFMALDGTPEQEYITTKINNNVKALEGLYNITAGTFPPSNPACPGYNAATTTDVWCWGHLTMGSQQGQVPPYVLASSDPIPVPSANTNYNFVANGINYINPTNVSYSQTPFEDYLVFIDFGWAGSRGYTVWKYIQAKFANFLIGLTQDSAVTTPYFVNMYQVPAYFKAGTNGSWPTTWTQWMTGWINGAFQGGGCSGGQNFTLNTSASTWMCPDYTDLQFGYAQIFRAASSYLPGFSVPDSLTSIPRTGANAWAFINAAPVGTQAFNTGPKWDLIPSAQSCTILPTTLPNSTVGQVYNQILSASFCGAGMLTWSITAGSMPPGLTGPGTCASGTTCVISGTPSTVIGSPFTFTVHVTDGVMETASQTYTVQIAAPTLSSHMHRITSQ